MNKITKIYRRLTEVNVKQRTLPICLVTQNIILSLIVLVFSNVIISNAKVSGELNYMQVRLFYNIVIAIIFFSIYIFTPFQLSRSLNYLYKNNTIYYLLASKVSLGEITYAVFFRGFFTIIVILVSAFPIASISLYFGGLGISSIIRIIICYFSYALLLSSISLYLSSTTTELIVSFLTSYIVSLFIMILHIYFLQYIINSNMSLVIYMISSIFISFALITSAKKGRIFRQ